MRIAVVCVLVTGGAFPALFADAGEGISSSHTGSTVQTRTGGACAVLGCIACVSSPSRWAGTAEGIHVVVAGASITAGGWVTLALAGMAGLALPVVGTLAVEVVQQVDAASAVLARVVSALVDIEVAEFSLPAVRTEALKGVHSIDAGPSISTWAVDAVVNILVTVDATETRIADAGEVSHWLADASSSRTTDVRRNVPHSSRVVGRYSNSAAVDHLTRGGLAVLLEPFTSLSLVAFRTSAVEVLVHAVALGLILTRVWITSIRR